MKIKLFITLLIIAGSANAVSITFNNNTGQKLKNITNNQEIAVGQQKVGFNLGGNQTRLLELESDPSKYISASTSEIQVYNNKVKTYSHNVSGTYAGEWNITLDNNGLLSIQPTQPITPKRSIILTNNTPENLIDVTTQKSIGKNERKRFEMNDNQPIVLGLETDPENKYIYVTTSGIQVSNKLVKTYPLDFSSRPYAGEWYISLNKNGLWIRKRSN